MAQQSARRMTAPPEVPPTPEPVAGFATPAAPVQPAPLALAAPTPAAPAPVPATTIAPGIPGGITASQPPGAARRTMADVRAEGAAPPQTSPVPLEHPSESWGTGGKILGTLFPSYRRGAEERQQYNIGLHGADQKWRSNEATIELQQLNNQGQRLTNYQRETLQDIQDEEAFNGRVAKSLRAHQLGSSTDLLGLMNENDDLREMLQIESGQTVEMMPGADGRPTSVVRDSKGNVVPGSATAISDKELEDLIDYFDPQAAKNLQASTEARAQIGLAPRREAAEGARLDALRAGAEVAEFEAGTAMATGATRRAAAQVGAGTALTQAQIDLQQAGGDYGALAVTEATARTEEETAGLTAKGGLSAARTAAMKQVFSGWLQGQGPAMQALRDTGMADSYSGTPANIVQDEETGMFRVVDANGKTLTHKIDGTPAEYDWKIFSAQGDPEWDNAAWGLFNERTGETKVLNPDWKYAKGGRGRLTSNQAKEAKTAYGLIGKHYGAYYDELTDKYSFTESSREEARIAIGLADELARENFTAGAAFVLATEIAKRNPNDYPAARRELRKRLSRERKSPGRLSATSTGEYIGQEFARGVGSDIVAASAPTDGAGLDDRPRMVAAAGGSGSVPVTPSVTPRPTEPAPQQQPLTPDQERVMLFFRQEEARKLQQANAEIERGAGGSQPRPDFRSVRIGQ